jgi:hypothetical protein
MKNTIIIDIDTERDIPVQLGKPNDFKQPETDLLIKEMLMDDIKSVCEALCVLIKLADTKGASTKEQLIEASIFHLNKIKES